MGRRHYKKKRLAQNFLRDRRLVHRLVGISAIRGSDIVYEIGPGRGIITAELARVAKHVIAVEKDPALVQKLRERFAGVGNVTIVEGDFLDFAISKPDHKIFASIPYNLTAAIVRKVLYRRPFPSEAFLIMQKEAARKFSGSGGETMFSLLAKPYVRFRILSHLKKTDFDPIPSVESVLLRVVRREQPLLKPRDVHAYRELVNVGFRGWNRNLKTALQDVFTYTQWKRLGRDLGFKVDATPTQLTFEQWLGLYRFYQELLRKQKLAQ